MSDKKTGRTLTQDNWKRSQVRLPQPLYDDVFNYAEQHGISLNQAMIELLDKGLLSNIKHDETIQDWRELAHELMTRLFKMERMLEQLSGERITFNDSTFFGKK